MRLPLTIKRAMRLFAVFLSGTGLANLVTFLALPIYTRLLSPAEYGYFDLSQTYITIAAALIYADVWVGVMRFSLEDSSTANRAIRTGLQFFVASSLVMITAAFFVELVSGPQYLWLTVVLGLSRSMSSFWSFASRGLGGERVFAFSGVVNALASLIVTVWLLAVVQSGVVGVYVGAICGSFFQVLILESKHHLLSRAHHAEKDSLLRRRLARFSVPLSLNSVAFWVFTGYGRIVVSTELGVAANGVFAAASKIAGIVTVLAAIVTLVWQQLAFERDHSDIVFFEKGIALSLVVYSIVGALSIPIGMVLFRMLVDRQYVEGLSAVPLFMVVAAMAGYSSFVGNIFYVTERTSVLFWSALSCLVTVLALTNFLVEAFGLNGANIALIVGYCVNIAVKHLLLSKLDSVGVPLTGLVLSAAALGSTAAVGVVSSVTWSAVSAGAASVILAGWWWLSSGRVERRKGRRD